MAYKTPILAAIVELAYETAMPRSDILKLRNEDRVPCERFLHFVVSKATF